jgi:hypothetical protein
VILFRRASLVPGGLTIQQLPDRHFAGRSTKSTREVGNHIPPRNSLLELGDLRICGGTTFPVAVFVASTRKIWFRRCSAGLLRLQAAQSERLLEHRIGKGRSSSNARVPAFAIDRSAALSSCRSEIDDVVLFELRHRDCRAFCVNFLQFVDRGGYLSNL